MREDEARLVNTAKMHILARWRHTRALAALGKVTEGDTEALDKAHRKRCFYEHQMTQAQDDFCDAFTALEDNMTEELMEESA